MNCGDFFGDFRSNHVMRSGFRCSEDKEGLFGVVSGTFMPIEVILFRLLALIS